MPLRYKFDVLAALKAHGYTTYKLRLQNLLSEAAIQKLRKQESVGWTSIGKICDLLEIQPGDLLAYEPETASSETSEVSEAGERD